MTITGGAGKGSRAYIADELSFHPQEVAPSLLIFFFSFLKTKNAPENKTKIRPPARCPIGDRYTVVFVSPHATALHASGKPQTSLTVQSYEIFWRWKNIYFLPSPPSGPASFFFFASNALYIKKCKHNRVHRLQWGIQDV